MRIAIIAPGSRGDVEPYIALGKGLARAGQAVRLVSHQDFESLARSHGLEFWPVEGQVQAIAQSQEMRSRLEGGNFLSVMAQMANEAERGAIHFAEAGLAACQGVDLILAGLAGLFVGTALGEKLGLPVVQAFYIPLTPTRAFPSFLVPKAPDWSGGVLNRLSYQVARQVLWQGFRRADRLARKAVLNLPAAAFWGPFGSNVIQSLVLYGYSPAVIPLPPDWDGDVHVTGYWFLDPAEDWSPPKALVEFLEAGSPPVYVGFGSMSSRNPEETADLVVKAVAEAQQRAILLSGWSGLQTRDLPESVLMVDSVPFSWLFPRVAAVVHHGGAGTTAAGLRAGVPSVVVPFFGDQFFWGQRVAELGVGPEPVPRKKLTVERLADAIDQAVTDARIGQCAAHVGARIRAEDGVARAVALVEQFEKR